MLTSGCDPYGVAWRQGHLLRGYTSSGYPIDTGCRKLDELILANERARNQIILADKDTEQELADLEADFDKVAGKVTDGPRDKPKGADEPKTSARPPAAYGPGRSTS